MILTVILSRPLLLHTSTGFRPARGNLRLLLELELPVHTDLDEGAELLGHGALADLLPLEGAAGLGAEDQDDYGDADPHYTAAHAAQAAHDACLWCLLRQDSCSRDHGPTMTDCWRHAPGFIQYTINLITLDTEERNELVTRFLYLFI